MKSLFLLRGVSGSGKSTIAKHLVGAKEYCHKEADMYFVDRDGNYNFNPSQIGAAHEWCKDEVEFLMDYEHPVVVVSNTFTQEWELKRYYELAEKYGYNVFSVIVENRHGGVDVHGVPEEKLVQMEAKLRNSIKLR
jgi:ABC-type glutathione transport system ATPase component